MTMTTTTTTTTTITMDPSSTGSQTAVQALMLAAALSSASPLATRPPLRTQAVSPSLEGRFDASMFRGLYQRNNKRGGLKNLRCFPSCSAEHRVRGFCGRSVVVSFKPSTPEDVALLQSLRLRAFVEFEEEPFDSSKRPSEISSHEVDRKLRTKQEPTNPLIEGKYAWTSDGILVFEFNQERRGWHYSWGSNKHKCDTKHHLLCQLYHEDEVPGKLRLLSTCASPEFVLFCRRRRRFTLEPTGQIVPSSSGGATASTPSSSSTASKRARKTPNQAKVVQELELLSTVQRIEATRGGNQRTSSTGSDEDEEDFDDEEDEEEDDDEEEMQVQATPASKRVKAAAKNGISLVTPGSNGNLAAATVDVDVTDATHALLALNSALRANGSSNNESSASSKGKVAVRITG